MTRFFVQPSQIVNGVVTLDGDDALHLSRVLRECVGAKIDVLDGSGSVYHCTLTSLGKNRAEGTVDSSEQLHTEPSVRVVVAQSLPKTSEKLEWVLQHGVEVGVSEFWMFRSRRSEAGKLAERQERWDKILKTAAEQAGRAKLPTAILLGTLSAVISRVDEFDAALLLDCDDGTTSLKDVLKDQKIKSVLLAIGPEGGWSDDERIAAEASGMKRVSLGPRVLRTETAALVAASQVLYALDAA